MITYECHPVVGNHSFGPCLGEMVQAWGRHREIELHPGSLNRCATADVIVPPESEAYLLREFTHLDRTNQRVTEGYDPRFYEVMLRVPGTSKSFAAWLYRWSSPRFLRCFVGDTIGCKAERLCEIVAPFLPAEVTDADALLLSFGHQ